MIPYLLDKIYHFTKHTEPDKSLPESFKPKAITYIAPGVRKMIVDAINLAEELKGMPANGAEIGAVIYQSNTLLSAFSPIEIIVLI